MPSYSSNIINKIINSAVIAEINRKIEWPLVFKLIKASKLLAVILIYISLLYTFYNNYYADVNFEKANAYITFGDMPKALDSADKAIEQNPLEPNYYRIRARVLINYLPKQTKDIQREIKNSILEDLEAAYSLNPQNLVTIRNIVPLYYFVATENILLGANKENVDPEYLPYAKNFYAYHKHYSPNDVGIYALLAKYEKRLNLMEEYDVSVSRVKELRPDLLDWYESFKP